MKKLVMILNEKPGDTGHICYRGGCPFFTGDKQDGVCLALWKTNPIGKNSLASLCNYYNTRDFKIIEVTDEVGIKKVEEIEEIYKEYE